MRPNLISRLKEEWNNLDPVDPLRGLIADAIDALAEQPAQQQEPVAWLIWLHGPAGHFDHKQFAEMEFERRNKEYPDPDRKLLPLYTSPQQSQRSVKPWVGLTDEERDAILNREFKQWWSRHDAVCRAIEAKLREKNA